MVSPNGDTASENNFPRKSAEGAARGNNFNAPTRRRRQATCKMYHLCTHIHVFACRPPSHPNSARKPRQEAAGGRESPRQDAVVKPDPRNLPPGGIIDKNDDERREAKNFEQGGWEGEKVLTTLHQPKERRAARNLTLPPGGGDRRRVRCIIFCTYIHVFACRPPSHPI